MANARFLFAHSWYASAQGDDVGVGGWRESVSEASQ